MKNSLKVLAVAFVSIALFAAVGFAYTPEASSLQSAITVPPGDIPGWIFTGRYLKIGINKAGTLGVAKPLTDPGVGFQFPIGSQYESLATAWWGEGFKLVYKRLIGGVWKEKVAFWQPDLGYPPDASTNLRVKKTHVILDNDQEAQVRVELWTRDSRVRIVFLWTFLKDYPYVTLETRIENMGQEEIRDVVYTRVVDWDVHMTAGSDIWFSDANSAWASYYNEELGAEVVMGVAGYPHVEYVDLNAWDDWTVAFPGYPVKNFQALPGDYNVGIYYQIARSLWPTESVTVTTEYSAGYGS